MRRARVWRGGYDVTHVCLFAIGRSYALDDGCPTPSSCESSFAYAAAGRYLAYGYWSGVSWEPKNGREIVLDLVTGKAIRNLHAGRYNDPGALDGGQGADASLLSVRSVLKRDGSVAWVTQHNTAGGPPGGYYWEVWRSDRAGTRMLDDSTSIDPHSLRLHASTITWTDGGLTRSASLR